MHFLVTLLPLLTLALTHASPIQKRYINVQIVSERTGACLAAVSTNGAGGRVTTVPCGGEMKYGTFWDIVAGSGKVIFHGIYDLALDAGDQPHNNGQVTLEAAKDGLPQQEWYLTNDERIAITGGDQCLDMGDDGPQTYQCTTGNTNQVWHLQVAGTNTRIDLSNPQPTTVDLGSGRTTVLDPAQTQTLKAPPQ